jgi:hypothetical protein
LREHGVFTLGNQIIHPVDLGVVIAVIAQFSIGIGKFRFIQAGLDYITLLYNRGIENLGLHIRAFRVASASRNKSSSVTALFACPE